jgi:hypothetical protein
MRSPTHIPEPDVTAPTPAFARVTEPELPMPPKKGTGLFFDALSAGERTRLERKRSLSPFSVAHGSMHGLRRTAREERS